MLTPFLKLVMSALSIELEEAHLKEEEYHKLKEVLFDGILNNLPTENSTSNLFAGQAQALDTLGMEFDQLLNLQ